MQTPPGTYARDAQAGLSFQPSVPTVSPFSSHRDGQTVSKALSLDDLHACPQPSHQQSSAGPPLHHPLEREATSQCSTFSFCPSQRQCKTVLGLYRSSPFCSTQRNVCDTHKETNLTKELLPLPYFHLTSSSHSCSAYSAMRFLEGTASWAFTQAVSPFHSTLASPMHTLHCATPAAVSREALPSSRDTSKRLGCRSMPLQGVPGGLELAAEGSRRSWGA